MNVTQSIPGGSAALRSGAPNTGIGTARRRPFGHPGFVLGTVFVLLIGAAMPGRGNDVLAKGKGVQVTQKQLDEAFITFRANMAAQGVPLQEQDRAAIEKQLVEKLAVTQILMGKATDADRTRGREKARKLLDAERAKARSPAQFDAQVRASGMSPEHLESQLIERATCEEVLDRALRPQLGVTPEKVREFYDRNIAEFDQPERVRVAHIFISTRNAAGEEMTEAEKRDKLALAKRILERARKGEDFAGLAKQFSDDVVSGERGAEYTLARGSQKVREFETVAFSQAPGKISDLVTTRFGYHIIKTLELLPSQKIPFETVADRIKLRLELEATQRMLPDFQKQLFTEAGVEFAQRQ